MTKPSSQPWRPLDVGLDSEQLHPNAPLPVVCARTATPAVETEWMAQSGEPSSPTTQTCPVPQRTCSQGLFAHSPVVFRQSVPAGNLVAAQGVGRQVPAEASQKESKSHVCKQADFVHRPCEHTWSLPHVTFAQLGTQAPALQNSPAAQVLPAHGSTAHWRAMQS